MRGRKKGFTPKVAVLGMDAVSLRLVKNFLKFLPNFKKLIKNGSANEALPCLPCYTPTNWATIATGAFPGTHGAGLWFDNKPGSAGKLSTFDSRAITAEFIWESAERQGLKCLLVQYPGAYPPRTKKAMIVAPLHRGLSSLTILGGAIYSTNSTNPECLISLSEKDGCLEGKIVIFRESEISRFQALSGAERARLAQATEDGVDFQVQSSQDIMHRDAISHAEKVFTLFLRVIKSKREKYDTVEVYRKAMHRELLAKLKEGEWADVITMGVGMRFKLKRLSPDGKNIEIHRSEIYPAKNFTYPPFLSEELLEKFGPFFEHPSADLWEDTETCFEEMEYQVDWIIKTAGYLLKKYGWDLCYLHWHFPDSVLHHCLAYSDPASPGYEESKAEKAGYIIKKCLQMGDRLTGGFTEMLGKNDYIVVVSDHGNSVNMVHTDIERFLAENGFLKFRDGSIPQEIDWQNTSAYPYGGLQICINLKGREPHGSIDREDYEKMQDRIIESLYNWKDERGKRVICLALKKREAQMLGYWGDRLGDVYYLFNPGYGWGPVPGVNHGPQSPFAGTDFSSNLAMFIISGPEIRRGYSRNPERIGYARLVDIVPTLCHIMNIKPPRNSQGAVLYDLINERRS